MIAELATAVVDRLRDQLEAGDHYIRLMPGPKPHATMGDWFISVYPSDWTFPGRQERQLEEAYSITCTVTKRINANPFTHVGSTIYLEDMQSITKIIRQIVLAIHNNYDLLAYAAKQMNDDYPINTPLHASKVDASPEVVDAFWFWTDDVDPSEYIQKNMYGLVMSVTFDGAMRTQDMLDIGLD